jgi:hypothetical protein
MENCLTQGVSAGQPAVRFKPLANTLRAAGGAQIIPFPHHLARARHKA